MRYDAMHTHHVRLALVIVIAACTKTVYVTEPTITKPYKNKPSCYVSDIPRPKPINIVGFPDSVSIMMSRTDGILLAAQVNDYFNLVSDWSLAVKKCLAEQDKQ